MSKTDIAKCDTCGSPNRVPDVPVRKTGLLRCQTCGSLYRYYEMEDRAMSKARIGQTVRITDYLRAMKTCLNRDRGDGVLYGAGGCVLPSGILETPAVVSILGNKGSKRVCISWNNERHSMWIDLDNLSKA